MANTVTLTASLEGDLAEMFTLSVADVAKRFRVSLQTIRKAAELGILRGVMVGVRTKTRWRFSEEALREYATSIQNVKPIQSLPEPSEVKSLRTTSPDLSEPLSTSSPPETICFSIVVDVQSLRWRRRAGDKVLNAKAARLLIDGKSVASDPSLNNPTESRKRKSAARLRVAVGDRVLSVPIPEGMEIDTGSIAVTGVYDLPVTAIAGWVVGDLAYWDNTAKVATATVGTNKLFGKVVGLPGGNVVRVRMNQ